MGLKVYDLFCGLGGWAEGFLAEGYEVVGFDIEAHDYGTGGYPGTLILRDIRSLHGSELKDATCIVASPPCQAYSYRAMPWKKAKALPPQTASVTATGIKVGNAGARTFSERRAAAALNPGADPSNFWHGALPEGTKQGGDWFSKGCDASMSRLYGSKSVKRKMASAMIAKIPYPLAVHVAHSFKSLDVSA